MARVSIEDCLNVVENRFALVLVAAQRTRQLMSGKDSVVKTRNKEAVTALREIAEGYVVPVVSEAPAVAAAPQPQTVPAPAAASTTPPASV